MRTLGRIGTIEKNAIMSVYTEEKAESDKNKQIDAQAQSSAGIDDESSAHSSSGKHASPQHDAKRQVEEELKLETSGSSAKSDVKDQEVSVNEHHEAEDAEDAFKKMVTEERDSHSYAHASEAAIAGNDGYAEGIHKHPVMVRIVEHHEKVVLFSYFNCELFVSCSVVYLYVCVHTF